MEKTGWTVGNAGRWDGQTWEAVIAVTAVPDFKTVKKFATAVTVRIRNLAGRSKTGLTQQNVTARNKQQHNFETVVVGLESCFSDFPVILIVAILVIYSLSIKY